jgi:hypothetical protein
MARKPSACVRIAAERREYVVEVESESARYVPGAMPGTNCAKKAWDIGVTSIARRVTQMRSAS